MRTGFGAVNKSISDAKARQAQGYSGKLNYLTLKDGDTKVVRFLTDDVLTTLFYQYVVNNQGRFTDFIVATDLHADEPDWQGKDWVQEYGGYQLENTMSGPRVPLAPKERSVGLAVLREENPREVDGRTVIGYQDFLEETTIDGKTYPARWFGVMIQSHQLFWNQMSGYHQEYGTICDRDYKIRRMGGGFDTTYQIIPQSADPDFDIKALQESYGYGAARPKEDPDRFLYCPQTLAEWAEYYCSEDRVKYWLGDPKAQAQQSNGRTSSGLDEFHPDTTRNASPDEAQAAAPPQTNFGDLRARLEQHT